MNDPEKHDVTAGWNAEEEPRETTAPQAAEHPKQIGVRLIATCILILAIVGAGLFGWRQHRQSVARGYVEQLLQTTAEGVGPFTALVRPLKSHAAPMLRAALDDPQRSASERLHAACALGEFGETDFVFPFSTLKDCNRAEGANFFHAFHKVPAGWLSTLARELKDAHANEDWSFKARLAIVALQQDDLEPAADMLEFVNRPDPIQRTVFIETFRDWHGDLGQLAGHVADAKHPGLRSGICLAVGAVKDIDAAAKTRWKELLIAWHQEQPDAGTHSATGWALRQWNVAAPVPKIDIAKAQAKKLDWAVTSATGLAMVRIPAETQNDEEGPLPTVTLSEFWLSDCEITVSLFRQFVDDKEYAREKPASWKGEYKFPKLSPSDQLQHPVQQVSWYDAVMFCNWLSWREGREACYKVEKILERGRLQYKVEPIERADGFRLPTQAEWEYACRAGTSSLKLGAYSFGDDAAFLTHYGVCELNSNSTTAQCGSRMCNAWGLFDMHGNVWEWCWDAQYSNRVNRGGSWDDSARLCRPSNRFWFAPSMWINFLGFRVATVPSRTPSKNPVSGAESESR